MMTRWSLSQARARQIGFAAVFNLIFFLPYLGGTHFRVDQLVCQLSIVWLAFKIRREPVSVPHELAVMYKWSLAILAWAAIEAFVTSSKLVDTLQLVNTFSYVAGGVSLFILLKDRVRRDLLTFLYVSLLFSIAINVVGYIMWKMQEGVLLDKLLELYSGVPDPSYGEKGTIGAVAFFGGRVSSLFPHIQAYAVYDLMIFAIGVFALACARTWRARILCATAVIMSFVGGILTASKTYTFGILVILATYPLFSLARSRRRPRLNLAAIAIGLCLLLVVFTFYNDNRFLRDQVEALMQLDIMGTFSSRVGEEGYLVTSGTLSALMQPLTLLIGLGSGVSDYAWSDNGYFQVVMFGGVGFFLIFYGFFIYLCGLFARQLELRSARLFLALYSALFVANIGTLVFCFPRTGLLLSFFTVLAAFRDQVTPVSS